MQESLYFQRHFVLRFRFATVPHLMWLCLSPQIFCQDSFYAKFVKTGSVFDVILYKEQGQSSRKYARPAFDLRLQSKPMWLTKNLTWVKT